MYVTIVCPPSAPPCGLYIIMCSSWTMGRLPLALAREALKASLQAFVLYNTAHGALIDDGMKRSAAVFYPRDNRAHYYCANHFLGHLSLSS